jgi:hypothetical protein
MKILNALKCTDGFEGLKKIGLRAENLVTIMDKLNTQHNGGA